MTRNILFPAGQCKAVYKAVFLAGLGFSVTACQSSTNMWQGEDVLVEARHTTLERSVGDVSENHRELKDRFNALERLYVDLIRHVKTQEAQLASLESQLANFKKDPSAEIALTKMRRDLASYKTKIKDLESRVFSVEMTGHSAASFTPDTAPTGTAEEGEADTAAATGVPATPVQKEAAPDKELYGVHLASYRTKNQVSSGWGGLQRAFGSQLEGLTPLIYVQSQEGIGTFLRLIVGPVQNPSEAEALCEKIRQNAGEQYCKVSEYQGEPIG